MKNLVSHIFRVNFTLILGLLLSIPLMNAQELENYAEYKGKVVDNVTNNGLESVSIRVEETNINTITNSDGQFTLKVPKNVGNKKVVFSLLGYQRSNRSLSEINNETVIDLIPQITELSQVNVTTFTNAENLVRTVFKKKAENSIKENTKMTAFYRETIKRRNRNVSLTEAVVNLYKEPYSSSKKDVIELHKARKSTDYRRLDTVAVKLQGGPFSTLYIDIMKYPEYIFTQTSIGYYDYSFDAPSTVNGKPVYVINFTQKDNINDPFYEGKLYIDSEALALTRADYSLNLKNTKIANEIFVKKKPRDIDVRPLRADYHVDYREKEGKWYYGYGSVELSFKINKRRRLFNQVYTLSSEMAVTDWESNAEGLIAAPKNILKPTVVLSDKVSGFKDPDFWGPYNVIEPEKSIESAIDKIQRRMKREKGGSGQ